MNFLKDFGINPLLLAAQVVNFFILLFILKKFLYQPILKVLEARKKRIEESLRQAEEIELRLTQISEREEEARLASSKEAEKIIKEASQNALEIVEDGKRRYEEILAKAGEDTKALLQTERVKLQQEIRENLGEIVALALQKITGRVLTDQQKKEIIQKEVRNLS